jgi:hypothetical protein
MSIPLPADPGALPGEPWHFDKRIPIALLATMCLQILLAGLWFGRAETRLDVLENWVGANQSTDRRLSVIESRLDRVHESLAKIERRLDIAE